MFTRVTNCRACGAGPIKFAPGTKTDGPSDKLEPVFSLGIQPLANDFVVPDGEHQGFAPLEVLLCPKCGLAQLSVVVRPDVLYGGNYPYVTSKSTMMHEHFERVWGDCCSLATAKSIVEIGSNDGDFLSYCREHGASYVHGIEPAQNLATTARAHDVSTICDFFTTESANLVLQAMPHIGIVVARHVFCHVDDWQGFMRNLSLIANQDTVIFIEVPYVMNQMTSNSFDQIYHEHLSYLSIRAFQALLNCGPFQLQEVYHYPIHGGAIGLVVQRRVEGRKPGPSVYAYLKNESILGLGAWRDFSERSGMIIRGLGDTVRELVRDGKRVCGLGASAKSTVWINACGFTKREIYGVYDCTPEKWYRQIPGTQIPIINEGAFYADDPHYAVLFAWNFAAEIIAKNQKWLKGGGKFIVPIPRLRVIGIDGDAPTA